MSPKIVDKEKRRKEIALATLEIFSEKGFEATSISQVAELAGIGKGTIYEYFGSKEELILSAIKAWVETVQSEVEKRMEGIDDPVERLRMYAHSVIAACAFNKRAIRSFIAMLEIVLKDDESRPQSHLISGTMHGFCEMIAGILRDGVSQGIFLPEVSVDADKIAINLLAYLDGIAMYYYMLKDHIDLGDQIDFYLDGFLKSLRAENGDA